MPIWAITAAANFSNIQPGITFVLRSFGVFYTKHLGRFRQRFGLYKAIHFVVAFFEAGKYLHQQCFLIFAE